MVVVFALAGVPVWRLTRPAAAVAASVEEAPASQPAAPLEVEADFAPAPAGFQVCHLDRPVLAGSGPLAHFAGRWAATLPPEGVDLVLTARWPPGTARAAARLIVRLSDGRRAEKSFWAGEDGSLTEVFGVPGTP